MIPLSILIYPRGAGGVPDTTARADNLRGKANSWEQTTEDRYGFRDARCSFDCSINEALEWVRPDQLMRFVEAYTPQGAKCWEGFLYEAEIRIGRVSIVLSLKDMANRLVVRYSNASSGGTDATSTYTEPASIATYGTKDRLLNLQSTSSTGAANRAQTALNMIAYPRSKQPSEAGTGAQGAISVDLRFVGRYALLDWLLTSSTSTTVTATDVQLVNLLTAYNVTNNFFSTDRTNIVATGVSDTTYIDPQTTYLDKIEALLSQGDSTHERLHWGCFDDGQFTVRRWAGATPDVISYYESSRTGTLRDTEGNIVAPWDVRPDCMVQVVDVLDLELPDGAVDSSTRKYVSKVTLSVSPSGVSVRLDPDNVDSLEQLLTQPAGSGAAGTSDRQAAIERKTTAAIRTRFPAGDNTDRYTGGVWTAPAGGTGKSNPIGTVLDLPSSGTLDLGGGTVSLGGGTVSNTGGGAIDLGTGSGIGGTGSAGVTTSTAIVGSIAKWATTASLTNATAGTDYAAASHTHAAADTISGVFATARLGSGTASSSTFLRGDSTWQALSTLTPATIGAAPDDAKYIVQTASSGLSAEQALSSLATGLLKNTTTTGVLSIATAGTDYAAASHTHAAADTISGVFATARLGSGTASSSTFLRGDSTWQALSTITPATIGAAPDDAKYIVQTASSGLSAEQALSSLATGLLKNTTTTGVLSIATAADLPAHASRHGNGGADEIAIDTSQITTGTVATARLGSGTASSSTFLRGDSTWQTLSTVTGTGANTRVAFWTSTSALSSDTGLTFDATNNDLSVGRYISTLAGVNWDWGNIVLTQVIHNAHVPVKINGTTYYLMASTGGN